jgi:DNA helicase-2/ATP-dependent DNA helicase PcrA
VDEMQDTSLLEYSVLKRIFGKSNVMTCGDFFQSIYEWRGSRPERVLGDFIQEFSAKVYTFSENYRSTKLLTSASFGYLKRTYPDLLGKYCPDEIKVRSEDEGEKILLLGFDNQKEEAHRIYRYLRKCVAEKSASLCVMARSNAYLGMLLRAFEQFNLEYAEEERLRFFTAEENLQFYKKPVIKDVLAAIKLLFNSTDRVSMERITERYVRLVGAKTIEQIRLQNRVGASIVSFLIDNGVFTLLDQFVFPGAFAGRVALSTIIARCVSAPCNFLMNRNLVFKSTADPKKTGLRYAILCVAILLMSTLALTVLSWLGMPKWLDTIAKIIIDSVLYLVSYRVQNKWVFAPAKESK